MAQKIKVPFLTKQGLLQDLRSHGIPITQLIKDAMIQAEKTHDHVKRLNGSPYLDQHIYPMVKQLREYCAMHHISFSDEFIAAILLHDVMEDDRKITPAIFKKKFGENIYLIVKPLTKPSHRSGMSYEQMIRLNTKLWNHAKKSNQYSILIKLADKLNNYTCDINNIEDHPAWVKRNIKEAEKNYIPYTKKHNPYFHKKFVALVKELRNALKT
jgi:(p)ppGpp synthase/HD superfamily hydrolase